MSEIEATVAVLKLAIVSFTFVAIAWMFLRRRSLPSDKGLSSSAEQRLERIEHAVDTMAIEVERISEGQRFLNKLMTGREGDRVPLPSAPSAERDA